MENKLMVEEVMAVSNVVGYLEGLVKGFKEGKIVVEKGCESLVLTLPEFVDVEVEAKLKKGKAKFGLELSWTIPAPAEDPLTISSQETAPAPPAAPAAPCASGTAADAKGCATAAKTKTNAPA